MTSPKPRPASYTPLGRVADSRFFRTRPMVFLDSSASPRRRVKSLLWFMSGTWRGVAVRAIARQGLRTADQVLGRRSGKAGAAAKG